MNECVGITCMLMCVCVRTQTHRAFTYSLNNYSELKANCLGKASLICELLHYMGAAAFHLH